MTTVDAMSEPPPATVLAEGSSSLMVPRKSAKTKRRSRTTSSSSEEDHARPVKKRKVEEPIEQPLASVVYYDAREASQETPLYSELNTLDSDGRLTRHYKSARKVNAELGRCAADLFWRHLLLGTQSNREGENLQAYQDVVETHTFELPNIRGSENCNVSPKFARLVETLQPCEFQDDSVRGTIIGTTFALLCWLRPDSRRFVSEAIFRSGNTG